MTGGRELKGGGEREKTTTNSRICNELHEGEEEYLLLQLH